MEVAVTVSNAERMRTGHKRGVQYKERQFVPGDNLLSLREKMSLRERL